MAECHERIQGSRTVARLKGGDGCGRMTVDAGVFVKEDLRRGSDAGGWHAAVVPRFHAPAPAGTERQYSEPGRMSVPAARPPRPRPPNLNPTLPAVDVTAGRSVAHD